MDSMMRIALVAAVVVATLATPGAAVQSGLDTAAKTISAESFLRHVSRLASDEFEGRSPSSKGETKTIYYLAETFKALGVLPGNPDGTYFQRVPLLSYRTDPSTTLSLEAGGTSRQVSFGDKFIAWTRRVVDHVDMSGEMVFVGYGVTAPEFEWDDLKGEDVRGKVLVVLVNDPPLPDEQLFGGRAMTYYGRWTYKFEQAARLGAAGCLIVHETGPAGYPWDVVRNSWSGESFATIGPDNNAGVCPVEGWMTTDTAEAVFAMAGQSFDAAKAAALGRDFKPIRLGVKATLSFDNAIRQVESRNVVALIEGSDAKLKNEYVVYTAHWDHFGIGVPVDGDTIYNGAVDNATGVAATLEIAKAFKKRPKPPRRSILFVLPTAEERGLLGSEYYTRNPLYPLERTVAVINIDGLNVYGRTRDFGVIGLGKSTLDEVVAGILKRQGRTVRGDAEPEKGYYYRSDHFNFAKAGVPALHFSSGTDYAGKPADFGMKTRDAYIRERYHKPSDEVMTDWDLAGAVEDMQVFFQLGLDIASADAQPAWREGDEFKARRDAMLQKRGRR
jgi:Zn-dependent M28 family amino/carboxypeptidase